VKRTGLLNAPLLGLVGRLGHTDELVVADCGLPVPAGVPVVDLAVRQGLPGIHDVLDALLDELVVEAATLAEEGAGSAFDTWVSGRVPCPVDRVSHAELKRRTAHAAFVVRTGEATPYANVVLRAGVPFS
jgi:D-ribose pyranase